MAVNEIVVWRERVQKSSPIDFFPFAKKFENSLQGDISISCKAPGTIPGQASSGALPASGHRRLRTRVFRLASGHMLLRNDDVQQSTATQTRR